MNKLITVLVLCAVAGSAPAQTNDTEKEKLSYAIGVLFARNLNLDLEVDNGAFLAGIGDVLNDAELRYPPAELQQVVERYRTQQIEERDQQAAANTAQGRGFLEQNRSKAGVVELPSGLQYQVLEKAEGPRPTRDDTVVVHYEGTLVDGTVFDSSHQRGEPLTIPLNRVIQGWQQAVTLMPVGSKWKIFVPPDLGYGDKGAGTDIGPNATLIFEIELLGIE